MYTPQLMNTDSRIPLPDWDSDPPNVLTMLRSMKMSAKVFPVFLS